MNRYAQDDRGAVAVTVAILLIVLVLFAAIAVDLGYLFTARRQLQTAADAAALAGCRILAEGGIRSAIDSEATLYAANYNANNPGDGLGVEAIDTDMATYVQVTVAKDAPLFFGRVLGDDASLVRASARAQIAYAAGVGGLMPWGITVARAQGVEVSLEMPDGTLQTQTLTYQDAGAYAGYYTGTITAPDVRREAGYRLSVTVRNSQTFDDPNGVPETLENAAIVVVPPETSPVKEIWVEDPVETTGETSSYVYFKVASTEKPAGTGVNAWTTTSDYDMNGNRIYYRRFTVPTESNLNDTVVTQVQSVTVGSMTISPAATVFMRRQVYLIEDVQLSDYCVSPNTPIDVRVKIMEFVSGVTYELRMDSGAGVTGNFGAMDYSIVQRDDGSLDWEDWPVINLIGTYDPYKDAMAFPVPPIYIGDVLWAKPVVGEGAAHEAALDQRFGDPPDPNPPVVLVPILERLWDSSVTATTQWDPYRCVELAYFELVQWPGSTEGLPGPGASENTIKGRFIKYAGPFDDIVEDDPGGLNVQVVRLVPPQ
jgi:hypothetical protein